MATKPTPSPATRWTGLQITVLLLVFLLYFSDGLDNQVLPVALPSILKAWGRSSAELSGALAAGYIGGALGGMSFGYLADRFGRRPVLIGAAMLFGLATMSMGATHRPVELASLRLVAGFGFGGCLPVALAMVSECVHPSRKGLVMALALTCPTGGFSAAGLLAATVIPTMGWPWLFVIVGALPLVVGGLIALFVPESPVWLARHPRHQAHLARVSAQLGLDIAPQPAAARKGGQWSSLRASGSLLALTGLALAFFAAYLALTLMISWLPTMLTQSGMALRLSVLSSSTWSSAGIAGVLGAGWIVGRWGAHRVANGVVAGACVVAVLLIPVVTAALDDMATPGEARPALWAYFALIALSGLAMNGIMSSFYAVAAETLPATVRATGLGLLATIGRAGGVFGAFVGGRLVTLQSSTAFFAVLALVLAAAAVALNLSRLMAARAQAPTPEAAG